MVLQEEIIQEVKFAFHILLETDEVDILTTVKNHSTWINQNAAAHYQMPGSVHGQELTMKVHVTKSYSSYLRDEYPAYRIQDIIKNIFLEEVFRKCCVLTYLSVNMDPSKACTFNVVFDFIIADFEKFAKNLQSHSQTLYDKEFIRELERTLKE